MLTPALRPQLLHRDLQRRAHRLAQRCRGGRQTTRTDPRGQGRPHLLEWAARAQGPERHRRHEPPPARLVDSPYQRNGHECPVFSIPRHLLPHSDPTKVRRVWTSPAAERRLQHGRCERANDARSWWKDDSYRCATGSLGSPSTRLDASSATQPYPVGPHRPRLLSFSQAWQLPRRQS